MAKSFIEQSITAKRIFDQVDSCLQRDLSSIIFSDQAELLSDTINAQPAIMACSMAILECLKETTGKPIEQLCNVVAGHSLGEYSSLCATQALNLEQTTKLLDVRAKSMQAASKAQPGAMAACLKIDATTLQQIIDQNITHGACQIANDNSNDQIVISGDVANIDKIVAILKDKKIRAIRLNVSAAFHSNLMKAAEQPMSQALNNIAISSPKLPIIANVTANLEQEPQKIQKNLIQQICGNVRWRETMDRLAQMGVTEIVEIGPGSVLSNLAKKTSHKFDVHNISTIEQMEQVIQQLKL